MKSNYDWAAYCQALSVTRDELLQVADQEKLPRRPLSQKESEHLLKALKKYAAAKDLDAIAQQSLF